MTKTAPVFSKQRDAGQQWFGERVGVRVERTVRETVRPQMTQRPDSPRQSRGIRM